MKRVLLTVHKFFPEHRAGTEVLTLKVAQELQRRGYEVLVLTANPPDMDARYADGPDTESYIHDGVPVKVFREPLRLRNYTFQHEYAHPAMAAEFDRTIAEFKPDVVHIFHAQNLSASIIDVARSYQLPVVFSATDFWFVCPIVQLTLPDGSVCRGPSAGAKNCLQCYTPKLFPSQSQFEEALAERFPVPKNLVDQLPAPIGRKINESLYRFYIQRKRAAAESATISRPGALRAAANKLQAIMVPTKLMRDIFVENGISQELIRIVPFGIHTAPLLPFCSKAPSDVIRIGYVGALSYHKGVDLLIEAFQSLPANARARLKIYGDLNQFPDYGTQLQQLAQRQAPNSTSIEFCGTFPNSQFGEVLQNLDVLVVPSRWYENTPLVMQSALATKTPLIVTDLGGMSEIVHHGVNGLLFKLNDSDSLAAQLRRLLDEPQLAQQLSANIKPERTIADMADDIESIYAAVGLPPVHDRIASLVGK